VGIAVSEEKLPDFDSDKLPTEGFWLMVCIAVAITIAGISLAAILGSVFLMSIR